MDKLLDSFAIVLFYYVALLVPIIIGCIIEKISDRKELMKSEKQVDADFKRGEQDCYCYGKARPAEGQGDGFRRKAC